LITAYNLSTANPGNCEKSNVPLPETPGVNAGEKVDKIFIDVS
jgi:hypothetical protein